MVEAVRARLLAERHPPSGAGAEVADQVGVIDLVANGPLDFWRGNPR